MLELHFSVSQLDVFRAWEEDPDADMAWLVKELTAREETPDMRRGLAFHKALERLGNDDVEEIGAKGYSFRFDGDFEFPAYATRELKRWKDYGGIEIRGRVDAVQGRHIIDHKASTWFDAERYMKKYQWRYYLDLWEANKFTWYVWEMQEGDDELTWVIRDLHILEQYRYPELEHDCRELALRLKVFAEQHLPPITSGEASIRQAKGKYPLGDREELGVVP